MFLAAVYQCEYCQRFFSSNVEQLGEQENWTATKVSRRFVITVIKKLDFIDINTPGLPVGMLPKRSLSPSAFGARQFSTFRIVGPGTSNGKDFPAMERPTSQNLSLSGCVPRYDGDGDACCTCGGALGCQDLVRDSGKAQGTEKQFTMLMNKRSYLGKCPR